MPNTQVLKLNENNFKEAISQGLTVVDFWAEWCMPCRMLEPIMEKVAARVSPKIKICKLNIDENPGISMEYNVMTIPAVLIYRDGQVVNQLLGLRPEKEFLEAINAVVTEGASATGS